MGIVKQYETGSQHAGRQRISGFPHDEEDHRDGQSPQSGRHCAESDIRNFVIDIGVADVVEQKVAIVANQPPHESEEQFAKWRVHIEEISSL